MVVTIQSRSSRNGSKTHFTGREALLEKTRGLSLSFVSHQRPKFTAKARSSQSLRTRQEAPGADQPILNGNNADSPGQSEAPPWVRPRFFPTVAWPSEAVRGRDDSIMFIQKRVEDPFYGPKALWPSRVPDPGGIEAISLVSSAIFF